METTSTGTALNGATELYYETFGDFDHPTLLLVNGLGSQLISYLPKFCEGFVAAGFHVIRFDNRDVGLSSKTEGRAPVMKEVLEARAAGRSIDVPYTLSDMAADAVAVLDALGVETAHIWGMSMGGMIVQVMAVEHPERVMSLTTVMSTTGNPKVGGATPE
ncbi:MAG: alpha/beta hydrolase, partial [Actinomycetota bacterium]|nr:alpha/beta hydrolase [Actinomycetota bacterium]